MYIQDRQTDRRIVMIQQKKAGEMWGMNSIGENSLFASALQPHFYFSFGFEMTLWDTDKLVS